MRISFLGMGLTILTLAPVELRAESVPPPLRNKTLAMSWTAERTVLTPRGEERSRSISAKRLIYISGNGRFFVATSRNSREVEVGPGDKTRRGGARDIRFSGGKIVGVSEKRAGAGRMTVSFNPDYTSCSVNFTFGKPAGRHGTFTNRRGFRRELLGVTYSGQSCSIHDGNTFAN